METGDLVLGTVEKVSNTITHVRLPNGEEATLISSEIAPGRIKHMRQYVTPNKKIVCKILEISNGHIHLSLRRVNSKEKKEVMQKFKQEQAIRAAINQLLKDSAKETIEKIEEDFDSLSSFIASIKSDDSTLNKYIPKENQEAVLKIAEKRKKAHSIKYKIKLKCIEDDGIKRIKKIFDLKNDQITITYLSAGNFDLKFEVEDFKEGKKKMMKILEELEKRAKDNSCEFESKEER